MLSVLVTLSVFWFFYMLVETLAFDSQDYVDPGLRLYMSYWLSIVLLRI